MRVLILVLSFEDNCTYSAFRNVQLKTWDSIEINNVETYYYYGGASYGVINNNSIFLDVDEGLENCGYKTIECFKTIMSLNFDYIFRTNSSSYIDKSLLYNFLITKPRHKFYCGIIGQFNEIKFASGSGYFLSRDLVEIVINNAENWDHNLLDDVALGKLLSSYDIPIFPSEKRIDIKSYNWINSLISFIPVNFFHYRLKSENRNFDLFQMKKIFLLKYVFDRR